MFEDTFKTIVSKTEGVYKEKGNKFISLAIPVQSEDEVKEQLSHIKKQYFDARHHCYAYILGYNKCAYRINDDGEPSGTAGRPIYGQLLSKDLTNVLVVVVRYFGGVKLGVSGLITAYKEAAKSALESAVIIEKTVNEVYTIQVDYTHLNRVMQILKGETIQILNQYYTDQYTIDFSIRLRDADSVVHELSKIPSVYVHIKK